MATPLGNIKKTIFFIGIGPEGKVVPKATGFVIKSPNTINYVVTAKHVIMNKEKKFVDEDLLFFFNFKNSTIGAKSVAQLKELGAEWMFHENEDVDIAMMPIKTSDDDDYLPIPETDFLASQKLTETDDVIFLSYQPGIEIEDKISPVIRSGTISRFNDNGTYFIDGFAFPGNSGSPVLQKPLLVNIRLEDGRFTNFPKLVGIIGAYVPYEEEAVSVQTGRTRIIFEDNTGLSMVWPAEKISEIIRSQKFIDQEKRLIQQDQEKQEDKKNT